MFKKVLNSIGIIVFIGLIVMNMITYKSCNRFRDKYEQVNIEKNELITKFDSVLNIPPDTITLPPEIIKEDSLIYVTKWLDKPKLASKTYRDSIINDSIDLRVKIVADELYSINYTYRPIYKYQEKIIKKNIPYPVEVIREIKVNQSGLFFLAGLGYSDQFSGKLGLMYLSKKQSTYGYDFIRYGNKSIHMVNYGIKF